MTNSDKDKFLDSQPCGIRLGQNASITLNNVGIAGFAGHGIFKTGAEGTSRITLKNSMISGNGGEGIKITDLPSQENENSGK